MDHVAIMNKRWKLIPKILSGKKTIESRWYQTRRTPWDKVKPGHTVYFKNAGGPVIAKATVSKVFQFQIESRSDVERIIRKYGKQIGIKNLSWLNALPRYCILIGLKNPGLIKRPFSIDKTGFGSAAAWLTVESVSKVKI